MHIKQLEIFLEMYAILLPSFASCYKRQEYLQNILENLPQYVYWKDINFVYQGCNKHVSESLNLKSPSEIVGKTDYDFGWPQERINILRKSDIEVIEKGFCTLPEDLIPHFNSLKIMSTNKIALRNAEGEVEGILGISVDITKEWQAETAKRNFLSNMEHDLRTPFAGIGGVADLLQSVYSDKYPELKEFFEIMTKSCSQWQEIHNRIFDALDLEQELKIEKFYIQDELEKIKDLMGSTSKIKNIPIFLYYPTKENTGMIETDLLKFKLILSSIVGNAFNFTEKGSVTIELRKSKTTFYVDIIDTGIGIPYDKQETIFDEFTKLSKSNLYGEVFKGMGLGLYNARRDAKKIHASIKVKSKLGKGSTFTLKLPIKIPNT